MGDVPKEKNMNLSNPFFASSLATTPTKLVGSDLVTLLAGTNKRFSTMGTTNIRAVAIITNNDANSALKILDSAGNVAALVFAQQQFVIESNDDYILLNDTAADIVYCVMELYLDYQVAKAARQVGGQSSPAQKPLPQTATDKKPLPGGR
jgi:hypothetical protein